MVEDTVSLAQTYEAYLRDEQITLVHVETGKEALRELETALPEVVLLDLVLPDMDGLDILKHIYETKLKVEVVVMTAHGSINTAVDAMRMGAFDFLIKPFSSERMRVTLNNALDHYHLTNIVETFKDTSRHEYFGFIGSSLPMQAVYRIIDSAAESKATVFITGESGTGKEVCAEAIHRRSNRADGPFIAINCGAIPKDLMESEIFGHVKGSFTGAVNDRHGAAQQADGGTLFLDEICELDLDLQTKLLRFVQTGTFQKVGGSKTESVDIRFVCATNRDPNVEVAEGRFREDLFYRLHVIPLTLPPLRQRGDDVLTIANHFLNAYSREEGKSFVRFSPRAEAVFNSYAWPGNIRQLQNAVRNIVVLNEGEAVGSEMLPAPLNELAETIIEDVQVEDVTERGGSANGVNSRHFLPRDEASIRPLEEMERDIIERAIEICGGNIPKAAERLAVSPSTLYRKRATWEQV